MQFIILKNKQTNCPKLDKTHHQSNNILNKYNKKIATLGASKHTENTNWSRERRRSITYLDEDGAVCIGMWVDRPRRALPADVAGEGDTHPAARGLGEERPRERRHHLMGAGLRPCRNGRPFHSRSRRPSPAGRRAESQTHCRILHK